jgi:hypothetical protein
MTCFHHHVTEEMYYRQLSVGKQADNDTVQVVALVAPIRHYTLFLMLDVHGVQKCLSRAMSHKRNRNIAQHPTLGTYETICI